VSPGHRAHRHPRSAAEREPARTSTSAADHPERERSEVDSASPRTMSIWALAVRLYWMAFGNILVLFAAIAAARADRAGAADVILLLAATSLIVMRYVDITRYTGLTEDGKTPATLAHWRRYALGVAVVTSVLWGVARWVSPL